MSEGAGRPTDLTEELFAQIKECILNGKTLRETAEISQIPESTLYTWHFKNYLNIADKIEGWKRDRKLILADITSDLIQTLPSIDAEGKVDKELLKIKQKEAEFIRETLGKVVYSKRTETDITTKGEAIKGFNFISNDPNDKTDNQAGTSLEEVTGQDN